MESQKKVNDFYPWTADSDINNQFILCLDNNSFSGEFIIHEMIIKLLNNDKKVHIISTNHNRLHYEAILRKNVSDKQVFLSYEKIVFFNRFTLF